MKIQWDTCPAKNNRVKLMLVFGDRRFLCPKCIKVLGRLAQAEESVPATPADSVPTG